MKVTFNLDEFAPGLRIDLVDIVVKSGSHDAALEIFRCCDDYVREGLAEKTNYPDILEKLASDCDAGVRRSVANNQNTPSNVLEKLANDCDTYVRRNVAGNQNTPSNVLEKLASDCSVAVRLFIVANPNTSNQVLNELSKDDDETVRDWVRYRILNPMLFECPKRRL